MKKANSKVNKKKNAEQQCQRYVEWIFKVNMNDFILLLWKNTTNKQKQEEKNVSY